jgi:putative transposase
MRVYVVPTGHIGTHVSGINRYRSARYGQKKEATKPAAKNFLQQQSRFDRFIQIFNHERPHEALAMKYPAELYVPSTRPYEGVGDLEYPFHDRTILVTECGRICFGRRKINLSQVFAGQKVGHQGNRGENLARQLYAVRLRLLRS